MSPLLFRCLCVCLLWLYSLPDVRALTVVQGTAQDGEGRSPGMAMIGGHPALLWANDRFTTLKYARALDAEGTAWSAPVTLNTATPDYPVEAFCLREVNGRPAVAYYLPYAELRFQRAHDSTGTGAWEAPSRVFTYFQATEAHVTMEMVAGNPAIVFNYDGLRYSRSADTNGNGQWSYPGWVDFYEGFLPYPSMRIVQGRPAVAYCTGSSVNCVSATDATGTGWEYPKTIVDNAGGFFTGLEVVDGQPAVTWSTGGNKFYSRATASDGKAWNPRLALAPSPGSGLSMALVGGRPAIAYQRFADSDIMYAEPEDATGESWKLPVTAAKQSAPVESFGGFKSDVALLEVNGAPAVAYYDFNRHSLEYVRALPGGWPAQMRLAQPEATALNATDAREFPPQIPGGRAPLQFTLTNLNPGSAPLTIQELTIGGPGAAAFSISEMPVSPLPAAASTTFTVSFAPLTFGTKNAVLHLATNASIGDGTYDIALSGRTLPPVSVERSNGADVPNESTVFLASTPAGSSSYFSFKVRNKGTEALTGLGVTIDGPDAAEFSLLPPLPADVLLPGADTLFVVRHLPVTTGPKSATVHVAVDGGGERPSLNFFVRMEAGTRDMAFPQTPVPGQITALAVQADGSVLASSTAATLFRFHRDGSIDTSFFAPALDGGFVWCISAMPDGKMLIGGSFSKVDGQDRNGLALLHADGTLDESFVPPNLPNVTSLTIQPDGKILAAADGMFTGNGHGFLVRLLPDGTRDASFILNPDKGVTATALRNDGHILAGGNFAVLGVSNIRRLALLDADGTAHAFGSVDGEILMCLGVQPDGKVVAGGDITGGVRRLLPGGTPDTFPSFAAFIVKALSQQADGTWLMGMGTRGPQDPTGGLAKFRADGTVDLAFASALRSTATQSVGYMALQADGKVLIAGNLQFADGTNTNLVRINNDPADSALQMQSPDTVRWLRGGSAPEVTDAVFHVRPAGAAEWTLLGPAVRVSGGWRLSGLTLPSTGLVRAQARAGVSLMEDVLTLSSPLEAWRTQYFQTAAGTGDAADDADPDADGLTNFAEFAFGSSPVDRQSNALPELKTDGAGYRFSFTPPAGRQDVDYRAEWSPAMAPGTWTEITDEGPAPQHVFRVPAGAAKAFVRMRVEMR